VLPHELGRRPLANPLQARLVSWLAGHRPWLIPVMAVVLAVLGSGGDILQITQGLPYAAVTVLMALILFVVLAARAHTARQVGSA
jgi:ABC-type uncharacterized transport system permease subunit